MKEAHLQAKEEARVATEKAWKEEEEREWVHVQEQERLAAEARARAEEEQRVQEEEERLAVERDLHEVEGSSWERAPGWRLFLLLLDSAGSLEEEEEGKWEDGEECGAPEEAREEGGTME